MDNKIPVEETVLPGHRDEIRYTYRPICLNCAELGIKYNLGSETLTKEAISQLVGKTSKIRCKLCHSRSSLFLEEDNGKFTFTANLDEATGRDKFLILEYFDGLDYRTGKNYDPPILKCHRCTSEFPYKVSDSISLIEKTGFHKFKCPKCATGYQVFGYDEDKKVLFSKIFSPPYAQLLAALRKEDWSEESIKENFSMDQFI